ncbi:OLC1v1008938C1 [Oldenlandia corymbosa var. corymbosa]|uniref:OLC1v1008938C1 n=1 Tax=Oldenlandia corymbosa var. corymbosa TaxID=529605 RepID=A0AAV1DQK3_OLDCO|nr:OLC1v1008938C1 [Oldenlandia corymbosa var. corymbosa]
MSRCLSFTASTDWVYRSFFAYAGLKSVSTDFGEGTLMHCWVPKIYKPSKPNLLLVHGFGANAMWQYGDLLRQFIPRFNIYVPDLLFFGNSWTRRPERTEAFQAQCLKLLMDVHGVEKTNLVGISYGGFVGYSLAVQFPNAIDKLVLCCTGVCLEEKDMDEGLFKVSNIEEAANILVPQTPEKLKELMCFAFVRAPKAIPSCFLSDFINIMCTDYVEQKKEIIKSVLKDRQLSKIPKVTQPTLIIWGEHDQIFPVELGHRLKQHIGENARIEVIQQAGHAVNLEKPKEFAKHLKSFLIDSSSPAGPRHRRFWSF